MSGVATAAFPLYNESKEAPSAHLLPPWQAGGRGKYAGKPFLVFGGSSAVGQFGTHEVCLDCDRKWLTGSPLPL